MSAASRSKSLHPVADHVGVEVAAGAGVDLLHRHAGGGDALGVVGGLLVPFEDGEAEPSPEVGQGPLEDRGLARARGADQVEGEEPLFAEKGAVAPGQAVVLGEDVLLDGDRPVPFCGPAVMSMAVLVAVVVVMVGRRTAAVDAHL